MLEYYRIWILMQKYKRSFYKQMYNISFHHYYSFCHQRLRLKSNVFFSEYYHKNINLCLVRNTNAFIWCNTQSCFYFYSISGTAYIFGNFSNFNNVCHGSVRFWDEHFINFALTLTIVDYIGLVVFILFSGYVLCESID
jgi:hypothetical protein